MSLDIVHPSMVAKYTNSYNVLDEGLKGNNSTNNYTTLNTLITSIGSNKADIYFPSGIYVIGTSITIPSNIRLIMANGAIIKRTNSAVITLNCGIEAGLYQIFDDDNTGSWSGTPKIKEVYPEWFGAKGDGIADDSSPIQKTIDPFYNSSTVYLSKNKNYKLSTALQINQNNISFICDGTLTVDNVSAIKVTASYSNIYVKTINGNSNGNGIEIGSDSNTIFHNNISVDIMNTLTNGFLLNPNGNNGVQYCKFAFITLNCVNCINFNPGNTSIPWINENQFWGGRVRGTYGIITTPGTNQIDPFNGNKFYAIGFEDIVNPISLNKSWSNMFVDFRMSEAITGTYYFQLTNSRNNTFTTATLISMDRISDNDLNYYNFMILKSNSDSSYIAGSLKTSFGRKFLYPAPNMNEENIKNMYNQTFTTDGFYNYTYFNMGVDNGGTCLLNLDKRYGYAGGNLNQFYIEITYIAPTGTLDIKNSTGDTIASRSTLVSGTYFFKWIRTIGWKYYKIA